MGDVRQRRQPKADDALPSIAATWQGETTKPATRRRHAHHASLPNVGLLVLGFVVFYAAMLGVIGHYHTWLPAPLDANAPQDAFSEARARVVLEKIMSFGYRPVGSHANDVLTPAYLVSQIEAIKASAPPGVSIEIDVQKPTGAFGLDFLAQFQNIYANVTNIVVRLANTHQQDAMDHSLMISSHYDAAIGGGAASDDGVNIAIMVELLRYFAHQPPTFGSLVFNFNGAEETIMQAAHGFITQHEWTKKIRAFINLEAAGAGGRELLFQTGSDELALAYAEGAKYPHASIIAQELFQTGVIPADTDFRVYRDYGEVAGMDFAYIANGYVYHTMLDDISRIQQGSVQRLGDNMVGIVKKIMNQKGRLQKIASTPHSSNTLFFDVAGLFMVAMGKQMAFLICGSVAVFAILYLVQSPLTYRERVDAFQVLWACIGYGMGASVVTSIILLLFAPLSWYSSPYLGAAAFLTPAVAGMVHRLATFLQRKGFASSSTSPEAKWRVEEALFEAMLATWLIALLVMLCLNMISSYIMAVWVFFPLVGQVLCHTLQRVKLLSSASGYIVISLVAVAVPVLHSGFVLVLAFMFFMPLMGRCGPLPPPDILMAIVFGLSLMIMFSYSCRFFCLVPVKKLLDIRNILIVITITVVLISTMINPYSDITPKRLTVQHVQREVRLANGSVTTEDAGLWVNAMDYRGLAPVKPFLANTPWNDTSLVAPPQALVEKLSLYGDVPFGLPVRDFLPERHTWYLPAKPPVFVTDEHIAQLTVVSSTYEKASDRRMIHLLFTGPAGLDIFIDAKKTRLTSWSIGDGVDGPVPHSDGTYILQFSTGMPPASFHFWIEAASNKTIEVGIVGHFLEKKTPEMSSFVDALPSWMHASAFVSTWSTRVI